MMKISLFGIKTCDNVRFARKWLETNNIEYVYVDLKTVEIEEIGVDEWLKKISWNKLINKKSLTWKSLSNDVKTCVVDNDSAKKIIIEYPLIIKRPITVFDQLIYVGFSEKKYEELFKQKKIEKGH